MTKTEIENKIYDLKRIIESCKNIIKANENEIKKLEAEKEKPAFKRVSKDGTYYFVGDRSGEIIVYNTFDDYLEPNKVRFNNNNYFRTKERAEEVADKINFLLELERLHDIYCPDYKPDWNDARFKWYVFFDCVNKVYISNWTICSKEHTMVYFDSLESACKVCDILNKELENA